MAQRDLVVHLIGDDASLQRAYRRSAESTQKFQREMKQSTRGIAAGSGLFKNMGRQIAFASTSFLGGAGLVAGLKSSVDAASNLSEQTNKIDVVFGRSGKTINEWAKTTAVGLGIANDQALEAAGTFGNLFRTIGLAPQRNAELSRSLVTLAADMASFNNADPSEVLDALRSGLIGEAEPLRRFGVLLSETRVQQEAMRETGKKNTKALTDQEKLLARYNLILEDTAPAQGDFARTSDGLANSQRSLSAEVRDLSAALGKGLKPAVEAVVGTLADGIGAQDKHSDRTKKISLQSRLLGLSLRVSGDVLKQWRKDLEHDIRPVLTLSEAINKLTQSAGKLKPITVFDVGQPGRSPAGAAPFQPLQAAMGAVGKQQTGLYAQFRQTTLALAKAQLTAAMADDRRVLAEQARILRAAITQTTNFKKRRGLYQQLSQVTEQIQGIDDQAARDRQDAAEKEKTAKQKQLDAEKKRLEAHRDQIRKLRAAWQEQLAKIREATDAVRGEFGGLPFQATPGGILGVQGQSAKGFAAAYADQTRGFVRFYNDIARLRKMGAPGGLAEQLRGLGPEGAGLVRGLVTHPGQLRQLVRSFREREKVVQQIAKADVNIRYATINVAGSRPGASPSSTRRGRQAGIPLTG